MARLDLDMLYNTPSNKIFSTTPSAGIQEKLTSRFIYVSIYFVVKPATR